MVLAGNVAQLCIGVRDYIRAHPDGAAAFGNSLRRLLMWIHTTFGAHTPCPPVVGSLIKELGGPAYSQEEAMERLMTFDTNANKRTYRVVMSVDDFHDNGDRRLRDIFEWILNVHYLCPYAPLSCTPFCGDQAGKSHSTLHQLMFLSIYVEMAATHASRARRGRKYDKRCEVSPGMDSMQNAGKGILRELGELVALYLQTWNDFARTLRFSNVEDMLSPYMYVESRNLRLVHIPSRASGYVPTEFLTRWKANIVGTTDATCAPPHVTDRDAGTDSILRRSAAFFITLFYSICRCDDLFNDKAAYVNRVRQYMSDFPKNLPDQEFTLSRADMDTLISSRLREAPSAQGGGPSQAGPSSPTSGDDSVTPVSPLSADRGKSQWMKLTDEEEGKLRKKIMDPVFKSLQMYNCSYEDLLEANATDTESAWVAEGKTSLFVTDPPFNYRRETGRGHAAYDSLSEDDMGNVVKLAASLLEKHGHGIIFCSSEQFPLWKRLLQAYEDDEEDVDLNHGSRKVPFFHVDNAPLVVIFKHATGNFTRFKKNRKSLVPVTLHAVHFQRNGARGHVVDYAAHDHVSSSYAPHINVIDNVLPLQPGEVVTVQLESGNGYRRLRPEQKPIALMKELIARFSRPGGIVVDCFSGTFSTALACATLPEARLFLGCEVDEACFNRAMTHVCHSVARAVVLGHCTLPLNAKARTRCRELYRQLNVTRQMRTAWAAPPGLPSSQTIPPHVLHILCNMWSMPLAFQQMRNVGVGSWPRELQARLNHVDSSVLRMVDAAHYKLTIGPSRIRHPNVGLGVFTTVPLRTSTRVCTFWGALIYHDIGERPEKYKEYGSGLYGVTPAKFRRFALPVDIEGSEFTSVPRDGDGKKSVWVVPAPFCAGGFVNDVRYVEGDSDFFAFHAKTLASPRVQNVKFVQNDFPHVERKTGLVTYSQLFLEVTRDVEAGEELYVDYGKTYDFAGEEEVNDGVQVMDITEEESDE